VLSQSDSRFWREVAPSSYWTFDFKLFKKGDNEPLGSMSFSHKWQRSGSLRLELEEGDYVVHVRLDRFVDSDKVRLSWLLAE
jgi:hypothetical protein